MTNVYELTTNIIEDLLLLCQWDPSTRLRRPESGVIELPPENVRRWTIHRKAAVVNAVSAGEVTHEEICRRYQISLEEFLSWQRDYESYGLHGLRSTRLQIYRRPVPPRGRA
jgi:hypothetical protein